MLNLHTFPYLSTALISSILGGYVLFRNVKGPINKAWFRLGLAVSLWSLGFGMMLFSRTKSEAVFWGSLAHVGASLTPVTYYHFILLVLSKIKKRIKLLLLMYGLGLFFAITSFTGWLIEDYAPKLLFNYYFQPGILYAWFTIMFFSIITIAILELYRSLKSSSGYLRIQLKYVLIASLIGFGSGATAFPLIFNIQFYPLGGLVFLYNIIITYAILKYRLMDIAVVVKKTTLLATGVLLPISGTILIINLLQSKLTAIFGSNWWLVPSGVTVLLTLGLFRFVNYVVRLKDEELNKEKYIYRQQIRDYTEQLAKAKSTRELVTSTIKYVSTIAGLDFCAVALRKEEEIIQDEIVKKRNYYSIEGLVDRTDRHLDSLRSKRLEEHFNLITYLKSAKKPLEKGHLQHILSRESPAYQKRFLFEEIIQQMESLSSEIVFPVFSGEDLVGLLFFGRKLDGSIYSKEDLESFSLLSNQCAKPFSEIIIRDENIRLILASCRSYLSALDEKDHYSRGHTERVKNYCLKIAEDKIIKNQLEKIPDGVWGLELAAELHDLGKIGIPESILNKPERLTDEEFNLIKQHPQKALAIIGEISAWLKEDIIFGILQHQEHYDGTGYPEGRKGEKIHIYARVIHIADAFDAMTSKRPYREALTRDAAIEEIKRSSGNQFDPLITGAFVKLYREGKI
jgi:HD-GYP domain-containing protein (c-di-GMP phosphodiesterase class II)